MLLRIVKNEQLRFTHFYLFISERQSCWRKSQRYIFFGAQNGFWGGTKGMVALIFRRRRRNADVADRSDSQPECRPTYPECVAFLHKPMRVREIVVLVRLSHSHGFAQKRNAFRICGTAPSVSTLWLVQWLGGNFLNLNTIARFYF